MLLSSMICQELVRLTNFALTVLVTAEKHIVVAVGEKAGTAKEGAAESLARLHSLHSEVGSHRLGDRINVFAGLEALLGQKLDLGASVEYVSGESGAPGCKAGRRGAVERTCSGTRSEQTFQSC